MATVKSLADYTQKSLLIFKLSNNGELEWQNVIQNGHYTVAKHIREVKNSLIVVGKTSAAGEDETNAFIMKINQYTGNLKMKKVFSYTKNDKFDSFKVLRDNGLIIVGYTQNSYNKNKKDILLVKVDENFSFQWAKAFGGSNKDAGKDIIEAKNGDLLLTGMTRSSVPENSSLKSNSDSFIGI